MTPWTNSKLPLQIYSASRWQPQIHPSQHNYAYSLSLQELYVVHLSNLDQPNFGKQPPYWQETIFLPNTCPTKLAHPLTDNFFLIISTRPHQPTDPLGGNLSRFPSLPSRSEPSLLIPHLVENFFTPSPYRRKPLFTFSRYRREFHTRDSWGNPLTRGPRGNSLLRRPQFREENIL